MAGTLAILDFILITPPGHLLAAQVLSFYIGTIQIDYRLLTTITKRLEVNLKGPKNKMSLNKVRIESYPKTSFPYD